MDCLCDTCRMSEQAEIELLAEQSGFSGVAVAEQNDERLVELASGLAHRAYEIPVSLNTRFGCASATKGFTALTAASLIESEKLAFDTPLSTVGGIALSTADPTVTIEQLMGHTSGVGDHLDEETLGDIDDHVLAGMSAHQFERPHHYVPLLNRYEQVSPPGTTFVYNNGGYVMLSLAVERAAGRPFTQLVQERVFDPAGMTAGGFPRSDDLPGDAAIGYLENGRSNVFHLPVIGSGDGGAYVTVGDVLSFWKALFAGDIVSSAMVGTMTAPRQTLPDGSRHYGLGFWIAQDRETVMLAGMDAGVSFQSAFHPASGMSFAVLSNTSSGVWPLAARLMTMLQERIRL